MSATMSAVSVAGEKTTATCVMMSGQLLAFSSG